MINKPERVHNFVGVFMSPLYDGKRRKSRVPPYRDSPVTIGKFRSRVILRAEEE